MAAPRETRARQAIITMTIIAEVLSWVILFVCYRRESGDLFVGSVGWTRGEWV